nr:transcription repressor OFP7 [Oryza sativa Japonica Group]
METGGRGSTEDAGVNGDRESRSTTPDPNASSVMTHGAWVGGRACVGSSGGGHDSNNAGTLVPAPVPASSSSWVIVEDVLIKLVDSMIKMLCTNGVWWLEDLQDLLACYLSLNAAEHHRTIVALFRRVILV